MTIKLFVQAITKFILGIILVGALIFIAMGLPFVFNFKSRVQNLFMELEMVN